MKIDFFRIETANILRGLVEYQQTMETHLPLMQEFEKFFGQVRGDDRVTDPALIESMAEEYNWTYHYFIPRSIRYSFIVLLFLVIEHHLNQLCDEMKNRNNLPIRSSELSGDVLKRSKIYLEKIASIKIKNWDSLEDLAKVRNCIVHALGKVEVSRDEKHLKQLAKKDIGISISDKDHQQEEGFLVVSPEYCESAVRAAKQFFDEIFDTADFGPELNMY